MRQASIGKYRAVRRPGPEPSAEAVEGMFPETPKYLVSANESTVVAPGRWRRHRPRNLRFRVSIYASSVCSSLYNEGTRSRILHLHGIHFSPHTPSTVHLR